MNAVGVNTMSFMWRQPARAALEALARMNYRVFEIMAQQPHFDPFMSGTEVASFARFLRDAQLEVETLNIPSLDQNLASGTPQMRAHTILVFKRLIDIAGAIGARGVIVVTGRVNPLIQPARADLETWFEDSFASVLRHAEAARVALLLENIPMGVYPDAKGLAALVRRYRHPQVRVCYDIANAHFIGEDVVEGVGLVADYLAIAHFSDTLRDAWRHDPIGQGDCDFAGFCAALKRLVYRGTAMLEIVSPSPMEDIPASQAKLAALLPA
ncbi:MAG: sugar phosphate isomerase/epimerase [Betaproteobacteria bacterium]|nr:sugar phosphate isomerase/epimerase [Betaproteobacteria bacterium]